ncbi:MAG: nicotinamide-nucleotide amidohydrolase family protein [Burkholderiaceae bacterium]|nr:nicotinamide-nucleotide amidohydrolase family protein [Burkholderiaceae bacterium]
MPSTIETLAGRLGELLLRQSGWLATAESCTGGLLAGAMTAVAGSSGWYDRGWITYSNDAKVRELGVVSQTIDHFGAVSEEVARQMAAGVLAEAPRATLALTTTGIAGPGGGTEAKPVGLVWFGFARRVDDELVVCAASRVFPGDRHAVRMAAVSFALESAIALLSDGR